MERTILKPYWASSDKTHINCHFEYDDGTLLNVSISNDDDNPDWKEVMDTFTKKVITDNTKEVNAALKVAEKSQQTAMKDMGERDKNEALFQSKIEAFGLEEVKKSKHKTLKSKIRKSKSLVEVYAYAAAVVLDETSK